MSPINAHAYALVCFRKETPLFVTSENVHMGGTMLIQDRLVL